MKRLLTTRSKMLRQHLKRGQGTRSGIFFVSFHSATCLSLGDLVRRCPGQPVDLLAPWPPAAVIPRRRSIAVHFQSVTQSLVVRRPKPLIVTSRCHQRWTSKRHSQSTENLISMRFLLVGKFEVRPFGRNVRVPSSPWTAIELPWQPKYDCGKRLKQQQMVCLWKFFYVFCGPRLNAWVLISRRHDLVVLAKSSSRCFPCRQCHDQTSTLWGRLKLCAQLCRVVYTFCRCYWCFLLWKSWNQAEAFFRRNLRKPLPLAENNVYLSVHEQFKHCQGNSSNSTWSLGLRKRDGSGSSPDHQCIDLASFCYSSCLVLSSFFLFSFLFFFCNERRSSLHANYW